MDGMNDGFKASLQKRLLDGNKSASGKYREIVVGKAGWISLLRYELVCLFCSWVPGALGYILRRLFYPCLFRSVGRGVVFGRNLTLRHPHKIDLGDFVTLDDNVVLDAKGEANHGIRIGRNVFIGRNTILSCKEGSIELGDYCNLSANCSLLSETELVLGKYCFLAGHCYLVAGGNHSIDDPSRPIMFQPSFSKGGIHIGEDVWLAAGVVVVDGVTLGKGCVAGAGSVVSRSFKPYSVVLGYPASKIKDRRPSAGKAGT